MWCHALVQLYFLKHLLCLATDRLLPSDEDHKRLKFWDSETFVVYVLSHNSITTVCIAVANSCVAMEGVIQPSVRTGILSLQCSNLPGLKRSAAILLLPLCAFMAWTENRELYRFVTFVAYN